jgi:hypothetical protein
MGLDADVVAGVDGRVGVFGALGAMLTAKG